jgi:phosphatidate cytidylyltransferase
VRTRIISGAVLLALAGIIAWVRGPVLVLAVFVCIGITAWEIYSMAQAAGHRPWRAGGIALALILAAPAALVALRPWLTGLPGGIDPGLLRLLGPGAAPDWLEAATLVIAGAGMVATLVWAGARRGAAAAPPAAPWTDVGLTLGAALYTGGILKYGMLLNHPPGEVGWLLLIVLGTAAADSGAYFAGRAFGKRKMIPHISPNKTWAGFWGGLALCVVAVALFAGPMGIPLWHVPLLGAAIDVSSVAGDLSESLLKRSFGAKDSSRLIPGHGGLLDRFDSILFVVPVVYAYIYFFYR